MNMDSLNIKKILFSLCMFSLSSENRSEIINLRVGAELETLSRLPRSGSVSTGPVPCNEYFDSIFNKKYPVSPNVQINYEHGFRAQEAPVSSDRKKFKISVKVFLSKSHDQAISKKYHSASIFVPKDLNFQNALKNRNNNQPREYDITANFGRDEDGEVIKCSGPVKGIILLSKPLPSQYKEAMQKVNFVIEDVPPSKKIQFYALFVMDAVKNEIVRGIVTVYTPEKAKLDKVDELPGIVFPNASIPTGTFGRGISNPNSNSDPSGSNGKNNQGQDLGNGGALSVSQIEEQMAGIPDSKVNYKVDPKYKKHIIPDYIVNVRLIYTGCGSIYSCFEHPPDCHHTKNCLVNLRFNKAKDGNGVRMIITASTSNWVAVGLSEDKSMGEDAVIICRRAPHSAIASIWDAYNPPRPDAYSLGTVIHAEKHSYVRPTAGSSYEGVLTCDFQLDGKFKTEGNMEVDFAKHKYYILLAVGLNNKEPSGLGSIQIHEFAITSHKAVHFYKDSSTVIHKHKYYAISFHEQLAIVTYGFLMPAAILMSRYGQHGLHQTGFGNYPWWLISHVCLQMVGIIFNVLSFFVIYIFRAGSAFYTPSSIYHGIVGPVIYIMSFANVIVGYLMHARKSRSMSESTCLKWGHWCLGHLSSSLGAIELIRGPRIPKSGLSCSFSVVAGFSYLVFAGANVLLMFNTELLRQKLKMDYPSVRSFLGPAIGLKTDVPKKTFYERRYIMFFALGSLFLSTVILLTELSFSEQTCSVNSKDYI